MKIIHIIRVLKDVSQWDLAIASGLRNYHLSHIERGRHEPRPDELKSIAKALEVPVGALTDESKTLAAIESAIVGADVGVGA